MGTIYVTQEFVEFLIKIYKPIGETTQSWSEDNGLIITAPAENRLQAVDVTRYFSNKHPWLNINLE